MDKSVLDGYIGIKFNAVCIEERLPHPGKEFISSFKENGKRLRDYHIGFL